MDLTYGEPKMDDISNRLTPGEIRAIALANDFKLKPQADGENDLHAYVYEFARQLEETVFQRQQAITKARLVQLQDALIESQDWNWLTAKEEADEKGLAALEEEPMRELMEIASEPLDPAVGAQDIRNLVIHYAQREGIDSAIRVLGKMLMTFAQGVGDLELRSEADGYTVSVTANDEGE
jgi:hypothetical protein